MMQYVRNTFSDYLLSRKKYVTNIIYAKSIFNFITIALFVLGTSYNQIPCSCDIFPAFTCSKIMNVPVNPNVMNN